MFKRLFFLIASCLILTEVNAQPGPGDWFREYSWVLPQLNNNEKFLHVGGRFDYRINTPEFVRGERYAYYDHDLTIDDPLIIDVLNKGANQITTGKTPLYNREMVHGMDVFYPGPMILIKSDILSKY